MFKRVFCNSYLIRMKVSCVFFVGRAGMGVVVVVGKSATVSSRKVVLWRTGDAAGLACCYHVNSTAVSVAGNCG